MPIQILCVARRRSAALILDLMLSVTAEPRDHGGHIERLKGVLYKSVCVCEPGGVQAQDLWACQSVAEDRSVCVCVCVFVFLEAPLRPFRRCPF